MNTQQQADRLLAQWQAERAMGIKPEDRLRQDNRSEKEWWDQLLAVDREMSLDEAIDNAERVGVKWAWQADELNLIDLHQSEAAE
jgi:hypothetical protein